MLSFLLLFTMIHAGVLERRDVRVEAIVSADAALDVVARGLTWTEGPLYLNDGRFIFADIKSNSVRRLDGEGRVVVLKQPSGYAGHAPYPGPEPGSSGMAEDSRGRVVVAGHAGRAIWRYDVTPHKSVLGRRTTLIDRFNGKRLNSPNDVIVARDGSIYFTDPPFGLPTQKDGDPRQEQKARVYHLRHPGERGQKIEVVTDAVAGPNGLALSPDERTLYVADTTSKKWVKMTRDKDDRFGAPEPFAGTGLDLRAGEPDGVKVDRLGNVFAAGPGGVWILGADGRHLGTITVPQKTSNVAWGDADRRTLFVTAGGTIYRIRVLTGG